VPGTDDTAARQTVEREVWIAGLRQLADELYDLRCEIDLARLGERGYSDTRLKEMRARARELEPVVGEPLEWLLQQEDAEDAEPGSPGSRGRHADVTFDDPELGRTALDEAVHQIAGRAQEAGGARVESGGIAGGVVCLAGAGPNAGTPSSQTRANGGGCVRCSGATTSS
jgi:hypothetical protein